MMKLYNVQLFRKMIVVCFHDLIHHQGEQDLTGKQFPGMKHIDSPDTGHRRSAVQHAKSFTDMYFQRCQSQCFKYFFCFYHLTFEPEVAFTDKSQRQMRQLYKVAACTNATMSIDTWISIRVDQVLHQVDEIGMYAGKAKQHRIKACQQRSPALLRRQQLTHTRAMATDEVIL